MCRVTRQSIGVASPYNTSIGDNITVHPSLRTYNDAYYLLCLPLLMYKMQELAFQVLNRTAWMSNKAFQLRMRPDPIVSVAERSKPWCIYSVNVNIALNNCDIISGKSLHNI
jgi:hypothetical protein